ncbi:hypothetical protein [Chryseobacterium sp. SIMBA_029]|uniref:hypothetical protein n=1 Tax=Chryseobacterium sp. SIMBA_029 TaxID=3085772 RepID=UPI00397C5761
MIQHNLITILVRTRRIIALFFCLLPPSFVWGQTINEYDKILKIDNLAFHEYEVRIYKKTATSTGLELFRLYQDSNDTWKSDLFTTIASRENQDKLKIRIRKSKLNSLKNMELIWMSILDTQILHLPKWESFKYKLQKRNKNYQIEDGEIVSTTSNAMIMDGVTYYVKIKAGKTENEFEYDNPESYLKMYPTVDELLSWKELIDLIKNEFNISI